MAAIAGMKMDSRVALCLVSCLLLLTTLVLMTDDYWRDYNHPFSIFGIPTRGWTEESKEANTTNVQLVMLANSTRREEIATTQVPCTSPKEANQHQESRNSSLGADVEKDDGEKQIDAVSRLLYEQWEYLYNDPTDTTLSEDERKISMANVGLHKSIPNAPHLQDCVALERRKQKEEELDGRKYPDWVGIDGNGTVSSQPRPPWIRGADEDNVPLTRIAQRDIWLQQHPPNCRDPSIKFAVLEWTPQHGHGLGSQLHIISTNIGKVLASGRVIVTGYWQRAAHDGCKGADNGTLECYFLGITTPQCMQVALEELESIPPERVSRNPNSADRIIRFIPFQDLAVPKSLLEKWGGAAKWIGETPTTEVGGRLTWLQDSKMYIKWWHAQTTAYMMRWPSVHLCRLVNKARHEVYGMEVAQMVVAAQNQRKKLNIGQPLFSSEALEKPAVSLDMEVWQKDEPYIPRPLLSIHVRQGDKGREMQLFQLRDIMWNAERLRLKVPDLHHVWLSTEMQTVMEESKEYSPRWHFMCTRTHRMVGTKSNLDYEKETGVKVDMENSLVNLIIASQADYFVGTLGSNWNRLLDEFRKTRGRNNRGYISLNDAESRR